ncbi:MAG: TonB-dependent receptor [Spongiibacter sp.]|uniref:TonB-dependent receptor n=2 Tax=Spongiibacteraceae TaxID=1706375 RepID=UPI001AFD6417|nr:TonB-dependent receptor [Spongiibacter sp.]MBO6752779.1 TonB-dependent receptor [Spongiibacter sp.]
MNIPSVFTRSALSLAILGSAPWALSQTNVVEEVVVTARKQSETLQDVPFSIAAMTEGKLTQSGATDLESMATNVAGISIQNLGPGQSQVSIRGISAGQIVRDQPGVKEQVGVYVDESVISMSLFTPDLDFYDINRVEVLRGPQGTLFGSGSLSGTVRYITNQPDFVETSGSVQLAAETVDEGSEGGSVKGHLNIPLSQTAAVRMVAYAQQYPGYIDAIQPDGSVKDDVNEGTRSGGRIALAFQPNDRVSIVPRVIFQSIDMDGFNREDDYNALANPYTTTRPNVSFGDYEQYTQLEESFEDDFLLVDLTANIDINDAMTLTSVTSYTDREVLVVRDASALNGSILGGSSGEPEAVYTLDAPLYDRTDATVITQELRLSGVNGPLQWVAGLFYSEVEREYSQVLDVAGYTALTGNPSAGVRAGEDELYFSEVPYELEQYAVFGELSYDLSERTMVVLGARFFDYEETRKLTFDGIYNTTVIDQPGEVSSDGVSPRIMLRHDINDDIMLNAQVSQGFRLGGINDPLNVPLCTPADAATFGGRDAFDDETLTNYEIGSKMTLFGGAGVLNASLFYSDIEDLQATVNAGTCSSRIVYNVPEAHSQGLEVELTVRPLSNFEFGVSASYVRAEIDSDVTSTDAGGVTSIVGGLREGNELPTAPKFELAATATYYFPVFDVWEGYLTASYQNVGARYTQIADQENGGQGVATLYPSMGGPLTQPTYTYDREQGGYQIVNLRLGASRDEWDVALFVRNATNERAELSLDLERGGNARVGQHVNQPRTVGLSARYRF